MRGSRGRAGAVTRAAAAVLLAGVALLLGAFGVVYLRSRGRALGLGDLKAMFAIGAGLGPFGALLAVGIASASGLAFAAYTGRLRRGASVPFGPHLALGCALAVFLAPLAWMSIAGGTP
ncbi:MAG: hypothetical protein ACREM2_08665, partial [Vulcanimicrobiaceae bacterium]